MLKQENWLVLENFKKKMQEHCQKGFQPSRSGCWPAQTKIFFIQQLRSSRRNKLWTWLENVEKCTGKGEKGQEEEKNEARWAEKRKSGKQDWKEIASQCISSMFWLPRDAKKNYWGEPLRINSVFRWITILFRKPSLSINEKKK